jgi:hypothetical protein
MKKLLSLLAAISYLPSLAQQGPVHVESLVINPYQTFSKKDTSERKQIAGWCMYMSTNEDYKHITEQASAKYFPGPVKEGAKKIKRTVNIRHEQLAGEQRPIVSRMLYSDPLRSTMYSTGLYAVAGQPIEIQIPDSLIAKGLHVQIGCHTDPLQAGWSAFEDWRRMPYIITDIVLNKTKKKVTSPFGGLVYINCDPTASSWTSNITIDGAIASPLYVKGQTSNEEWQRQLQQNKAPWGELMADKIILSLPDSVLQTIKYPDSVAALWDLIVSGEMELAQLPEKPYRPQRMVIDEHLALGYAHSGYPFMVHHSPTMQMLSTDIVVDPGKLLVPSEGGANWGFFHEIGHNMQNYDWVFDGTTEVSCNFFSLYMFDRLTGGRDGGHSNISNTFTTALMKEYFAKGANYETWKSEPFLGLILFRQLQEAFGWESFKTFFRKCQEAAKTDPKFERPLSESAKRDRWVGDFSAITQRNLAPFFEKWGIPISDSVKAVVQQYPVWMPYNFPPQP